MSTPRQPAPSPGILFHWPVIFDRGRVSALRGFNTREEAVAFGTLFLTADRVVVVEARDAEEAARLARRSV
jgi:hypothetical protein